MKVSESTLQILCRLLQKDRVVIHSSYRRIATKAQQATDPSCLVTVVYKKVRANPAPSGFSRYARGATNRAKSFLSLIHVPNFFRSKIVFLQVHYPQSVSPAHVSIGHSHGFASGMLNQIRVIGPIFSGPFKVQIGMFFSPLSLSESVALSCSFLIHAD